MGLCFAALTGLCERPGVDSTGTNGVAVVAAPGGESNVVVRAEEVPVIEGEGEIEPEGSVERAGMMKRIAYYIPNRLLDLVDVFRIRARVGPGLAIGARATDYLSLEAGHYRSLYLGLPGPRYPARFKSPVGIEREKGLEFCGIDATDDLLQEPDYALTEFAVSAQFLIVGGSFGIDPVEIGDFLAGLVFRDPRGDDLETPRPADAYNRRKRWSIYEGDKPATFATFHDRLAFVRTNTVWSLDSKVKMVDAYFAAEGSELLTAPPTQLRLGFYVETEVDGGVKISVDPDFSLDVKLPNLEKNWRVFITGKDVSDLPGTDPTERDGGANIGVRRGMKKYSIKVDAGVKVRWLPELFAVVKWAPHWTPGDWHVLPQVRGYWESDDGLGQLNSVTGYRWLGGHDRGIFRTTSSLRWKDKNQEWTWEQTFASGLVLRLLDERRRGRSLRRDDAGHGIGLRLSAFGTLDAEDDYDRFRATVTYRRPFYQDWVFLEISPEVDWRADNGWDPVPTLRLGLDILFSGPPAGSIR